jgi:hypothetical protein
MRRKMEEEKTETGKKRQNMNRYKTTKVAAKDEM